MNITKEIKEQKEKIKFYTAKYDKVFKAVMCNEEDDLKILNSEKKLSFLEVEEKGKKEAAKKNERERNRITFNF